MTPQHAGHSVELPGMPSRSSQSSRPDAPVIPRQRYRDIAPGDAGDTSSAAAQLKQPVHRSTGQLRTIPAQVIRRAGDSETPGQPATPASPRNREHDTASVVEAAASGEAWAWAQLVRWYEPRIRQIARSYRLSESDAGDVAQIVWIRLLENITRLRNPANVGAWLATTARRECLQLLAVHKRTTPVAQDDDMFTTVTDHTLPDPADGLIRDEAAAVVHAALGQLPARWRQLLQMLMENETPNYYEISDQLDMPVGSIGPTRGRALQRLRGMLEPANVA